MKGLKFLFFTIFHLNGMLLSTDGAPLSDYKNGDYRKDDYYKTDDYGKDDYYKNNDYGKDDYYETDDIYPSDPYEDDYDMDESQNTYKCPKEQLIISYTYLCDTFADCADASDEDPKICRMYNGPAKDGTNTTTLINPPVVKPEKEKAYGYKEYEYKEYLLCTDDYFKCPSLPDLCVPLRSLCDEFEDCPDGEDEFSCDGETPTKTATLPANLQQVNSSKPSADDVVTTSYMKPTASNANSENDHATTTGHGSETITKSHSTVTSSPNVKANLTTTSSCNLETEFECRTRPGDCVSKVLLCDRYMDCDDGSDEENCDCGENEYRCISGLCIPAEYRCDGFNDCGDHSDEIIGCSFPALGKERSSETDKPLQTPPETAALTLTSSTSTISASATSTSEKLNATHENVRQCQRNICKNGGTCFLRQNKEYFCECAKGFSGSSCQIAEKCPTGENCEGNHSITFHKDNFSLTLSLSFILLLWQRLLFV